MSCEEQMDVDGVAIGIEEREESGEARIGEDKMSIIEEEEEEEEIVALTVINPQEERNRQKQVITQLVEDSTPLVEGQIWYLLSTRWYKEWKDYVGYDAGLAITPRTIREKPGPIDNTALVDPVTNNLKDRIYENYDFIIVPRAEWEQFYGWYGGGPVLPRKVISTGSYYKSLTIEVRPLILKFVKSSDPNTHHVVTFSKVEKISTVTEVMCKKLNLEPENVRLWDTNHGGSKLKQLSNPSETLDGEHIMDGQQVLIEEKNPDGTWPETTVFSSSIPRGYSPSYPTYPSYSSYPSTYPSYPSSLVTNTSAVSHSPASIPGLTGLTNFGNTCFMNTAIQALSNTPPLREHFTSGKYKEEINETNPLGTKGELTEQFASLMKDLWSGRYSTLVPREFKFKLERFAPQFIGYQQHDSQELLAYLLDGLHEDLNRVKLKPYTSTVEADDKPDKEVAEEAWRRHLERNNSIIVDWFQGQLKSTLVCPTCSKVSITFDPFMYLSLPLVQTMTRPIVVTLFFRDPSKTPVRYRAMVPKSGMISDLTKSLSDLSGIPAASIVLTDVYNCRFFKLFKDEENLEVIADRDVIHGYEILLPKDGEVLYLPILHRRENVSSMYAGTSYSRKTPFGTPSVLSVPKKITYNRLHKMIEEHIQRYVRTKRSKSNEPKENSQQKQDGNKNEGPEETQLGDSNSEEEVSLYEVNFVDHYGNPVDRSGSPVDHYGNSDRSALPRTEDSIDLRDRQTLALTWNASSYEDYYDEAMEKEIEVHPSAETKEELEDKISLYDCLNLFTSEEKLGQDDLWYCNRCKEHRQATKKFDLWKLPRILVIHLKRFSYRTRYRLDTFVDFPLYDFNLSEHQINKEESSKSFYDLYAISNHYGSMAGGHYTCTAKSKDNKWYKFDDRNVSPIEESMVKTSAAYVLFYRRKDTVVEEDNQPTESTTTHSTTTHSTTTHSTPSITISTHYPLHNSVTTSNSTDSPDNSESNSTNGPTSNSVHSDNDTSCHQSGTSDQTSENKKNESKSINTCTDLMVVTP